MIEYCVPSKDTKAEFTEKRSRFIGHIWITETEESALEKIKETKQLHWDAAHNVYAYIIKDGPTRYSDDGEPQQTAGMPVLEVLRQKELYNVCCVVTRYFGGILLGAGGLIRAYARGAKLAADIAGVSVMRLWSMVDISCPYPLFEKVKLELQVAGGILEDVEYAADTLLHVMMPQDRTESFNLALLDLSAGTVYGQIIGQEYCAFPIK